MGRGRTGTGVDALRTCVRVRFTYQGARCVETLPLKPTPANIRAAERLVAKIKQEIAVGVFDYATHFPGSGRAPVGSTLFSRYADLYLSSSMAAHSTRITYGTPVRHWKRQLGSRTIPDIKPTEVVVAVSNVGNTVAGKTLNSYVSVLRAIFDLAVADGLLPANPCDHIKNAKTQQSTPDPLSLDEARTVLAKIQLPEVAIFYEVAMLTGLRPSEQIALRWGRVDLALKRATIDTAHVRRRDKVTKTAHVREVDLSDQAVTALERLHLLGRARGPSDHVFVNPRTGGPWIDNEELRTRHWLPALLAAGLRPRDAYQTRHTFATILLMAGVNVGYISRQLGHASVAMTLKHYAKWVESADGGRQTQKANDVFGQLLVTRKPNTPKSLQIVPKKVRISS